MDDAIGTLLISNLQCIGYIEIRNFQQKSGVYGIDEIRKKTFDVQYRRGITAQDR